MGLHERLFGPRRLNPTQSKGPESSVSYSASLSLPPELDEQFITPLQEMIVEVGAETDREPLGGSFADEVVRSLNDLLEPDASNDTSSWEGALGRIAQIIGNRDQDFWVEAQQLNDKNSIEQLDFLMKWLVRVAVDLSMVGDAIDAFQAVYSLKDILMLFFKEKDMSIQDRVYKMGDEALETADFWVPALLPVPGAFAPRKLLVHGEIIAFYLSMILQRLYPNNPPTLQRLSSSFYRLVAESPLKSFKV